MDVFVDSGAQYSIGNTALLRAARDAGKRVGLCFHVGSQCLDPSAYERAMEIAGEVIRIRPDTDAYLLAALVHEIDRTGSMLFNSITGDAYPEKMQSARDAASMTTSPQPSLSDGRASTHARSTWRAFSASLT